MRDFTLLVITSMKVFLSVGISTLANDHLVKVP